MKKKIWKNRALYIMMIPVLAYFAVFCYAPMAGIIMAFQKYKPSTGLLHSKWVGLKNFTTFFKSYYFIRLLRNTITLSLKDIAFSFPAAIIFALMLNEVRSKFFKKTVQTISYLPYFISLVVVCGLVADFTEAGGVISNLFAKLGGPSGGLLSNPKYFHGIFVASNIWQNLGYSSIVYISALSAIDPQLYEAARVDGATRWQQTIHITLPALMPTIIIMLILRVGNIMTVSYQKVILLYSPATYDTADVISTFVYRKGLIDNDYGYSTAVGLFNSLCNLFLITFTNKLSKKYTETSLW
ncbi:MAG: ABC transporter permease subunit [Lachnospiraceae bacterium]|nr:ABC transporter permease subunit [Lachnospiraceae bacterium]